MAIRKTFMFILKVAQHGMAQLDSQSSMIHLAPGIQYALNVGRDAVF